MPEPIQFNATLFTGGPVEMSAAIEALKLTPAQAELVRAIGSTMKSYVDAAQTFTSCKYSEIRDWIPVHLREVRRVLVVICDDGIIVSYQNAEPAGLMAGWSALSIVELLPVLSQQVVHCYTDRNYSSVVPPSGIMLTMRKESAATETKEDIASMRIGFDAVLERPAQLPSPPSKPYCLLSVRNSMELHVHATLTPTEPALPLERDMIIRTCFRLPVDWECIEAYPFVEQDQWKPEYASTWAENDILAAVAARQFEEMHFQTLDPNASARQGYSLLLKEFKDLLNSNPEREEVLQAFLNQYPFLLCPAQIRAWPKLALGPWKTDFVFQEAAGDYLLVELERSTHRLFIKDGHISSELNHARGQIADWKRYLEDNLGTVQRELGLVGISSNPKSLVVIGRSEFLTPENRRKLVTIENDSPRLKVVTYDDVYENAKAVIESLLGPIMQVSGNTQVYYLPNA